MQKKSSSRSIVPASGGLFKDIALRTKLILRLMGDRRVSFLAKLIPVGALAYWIWPMDAIAGIPGLSAIDDIAVLGFGMYMFIEMCPADVVREHREDLSSNNDLADEDDGDVIDGEATDVSDTK